MQLVILVKGKSYPDGTERTWNGKRYRKEAGKWKPLKSGKRSSSRKSDVKLDSLIYKVAKEQNVNAKDLKDIVYDNYHGYNLSKIDKADILNVVRESSLVSREGKKENKKKKLNKDEFGVRRSGSVTIADKQKVKIGDEVMLTFVPEGGVSNLTKGPVTIQGVDHTGAVIVKDSKGVVNRTLANRLRRNESKKNSDDSIRKSVYSTAKKDVETKDAYAAKLRGILLEAGISEAANASRSELVDLLYPEGPASVTDDEIDEYLFKENKDKGFKVNKVKE